MRIATWLVALAVAGAGLVRPGPDARAAETVQVGGVPAVLLMPSGSPRGSIILMKGGRDPLGVGPGGRVASRGNQLVRTRTDYAAHGFAVLVPENDVELSAAVDYMGRIARPVAVVGTSRGTQRAARGIARGARPDARVLTSGVLTPQSGEGVNIHVMGLLGSPALLPRTLVIHHRQDSCRFTRPEGVAPFTAWARGKAQVVWFEGGSARGDPCEPFHHHGFAGQDEQVVSTVVSFITSGR